MTTPNNPRKYTGTTQYVTPNVVRNRRPTGADFRQPETGANYPTACIWQVGLTKNPQGAPLPPVTGTQGELWMLSRIVANVATWVQLSDGTVGAGPVLTLSDTTSTLVAPTANGNIQLNGTTDQVSVTAGVNELTIALTNGITVAQIETDVLGNVFPSSIGLIQMTGSTSTFTTNPAPSVLRTEVQGTNHALKIGRGTHVASVDLAVGATGTVLAGNTGADPAFTATPTLTSVTFGAGTALSTYQQGVFTPNLAFGGSSTGITYSAQTGKYTQIGNVLYFNIEITLTSKGAQTGVATVTGLPVAAIHTGDIISAPYITAITLDANYTDVGLYTTATSTVLTIFESGSGQTAAVLTNAAFANNSQFFINGFYFIS